MLVALVARRNAKDNPTKQRGPDVLTNKSRCWPAILSEPQVLNK
jgi:hypothetical protein